MALAVPLSRFTSHVGGGSAFFVRHHYAFMKYTLYIFALATSLLLAGCSDSDSPMPLDSGTVVSGTVWQHSLHSTATENSGSDIPKDARVDIYESIIIIHLADGSRQIVPMDYVTNLKLK